MFFDYVFKNGITEKEGSAQAIWQVGKDDGIYLGILNEDGSIKDWNFIAQRGLKELSKLSLSLPKSIWRLFHQIRLLILPLSGGKH